MARFKFCLIGSPQRPVLELDASDVAELHQRLACARYIEGRMIEIDGEATACDVLIPANRIQMIFRWHE